MARQDVQRNALLIGVAEYDDANENLPVVRKDLQILRRALESSRYAVEQLGADEQDMPTRNRIRRRIRRFCADAKAGATLLLYYSGHGINLNNRDYLIPSDAAFDDPSKAEEYLVPVDLSDLFDQSNARTILFFVDACRTGVRTKDFSKHWERWSEGELREVKNREYAIVFSCGPGQVSRFDRDGEFSFFTRALADVLDARHPAREFGEVGKALQKRLDELTGENDRQSVKMRAEFDLRLQLLEREICDGPRPKAKPAEAKVEPPAVTGIVEANGPIMASSFPPGPNEQLSDKSTRACVLSTDLVGLTEFRLDHGEDQAIRKMLLHNKVSSDVIIETGGVVVKHVSDRVIGAFAGDGCEERAVSCGIAIIKRLEEQNTRQGWRCPDDLQTGIGVRSGRIWRVRFEGGDVEDYVGDPIDTAQRLCLLAGMGRLICDEETFQRIQFPHRDWSYGAPAERFVEGLDEPLLVRLVVPAGRAADPGLIQLCGFTRWIPDGVRPMLTDLHRLYRGKYFDQALDLCQRILRIDRGNFEAHLCCAEILLDRASKGGGNRSQILQDAIHNHLCIAKQIRPQANRIWRLLGWAYYLQATNTDEVTSKASLLSTAFKRAEMALECAQDYVDENGEARARNLLASILREQARLDQSKRDEYLMKANEYCSEVASQIVGSLDRTRSDHLLVHALVQADLGKSADTVERMLDQAKDADAKNPRVLEALAEFYRARGQSAL